MDPEYSLISHGMQLEKDWNVSYNPKVERRLDVDLAFSLSHQSIVCCVRFSADGKFLATGCNRSTHIYDTQTGALLCDLIDEQMPHERDVYIRSVCFSPDGKYLASGGEDSLIRIWDISKKCIHRIFEGHQLEIYSLCLSLDGRLLVSGSADKTVRIWDMESGGQRIFHILEPDEARADITCVAISPDMRFVVAGSLDRIVRIWDVKTGNLVDRLRGHRDGIYGVAFTPDGKGIVSASLDKTLKYWDISPLTIPGARLEPLPPGIRVGTEHTPTQSDTEEEDRSEQGLLTRTLNFKGHKDFVLATAISHDGRWVVSGGKDRSLRVWDRETGDLQLSVKGHLNSVVSVDVCPQLEGGTSMLATGSGDWLVRIWRYSML